MQIHRDQIASRVLEKSRSDMLLLYLKFMTDYVNCEPV